MATVKVKLRPSSVKGKAGTIYYQVTHRRLIRQITTTIHIRPESWDEERQRINVQDNNLIQLQNRIDCDVTLLCAIIKKLETSGVVYSTDDIVHHFKTPNSHVYFIEFMKQQIEYLIRCNQHGTAKNYERAMSSLAEFLNGDIAIIAFNEQLVDNYNAFLSQRGIVRNSISFYMRILRSVYNKAVRRHIVEQTNPFQNVYTGIDKTKKER